MTLPHRFLNAFAKPPAGLRLEEVKVVSAYGGAEWFHRLEETFAPARVHVVLDQGAAPELLEQIRNQIPSPRLKSLLLGVAPRLMHAKLYFCTWKAEGRARPLHTFHMGSANASEQGFGGSPSNAEAWLSARVYPTRDPDIFRWFAQLDGTERHVQSAVAHLGGLRVDLPSFTVVGTEQPEGTFDAWIQHGYLCHPFEPHPEFGCFDLALEDRLPLGPAGTVLTGVGLVPGGYKSVRLAYLGKGARAPDERKGSAPKWRSRLFVDTVLGGWTPGKTYRDGHDRTFIFEPRRKAQRQVALDLLRHPTTGQVDHWVGQLTRQLTSAQEKLEASGLDASAWFRVTRNRRIDLSHYRHSAREQVARDREKVADPVFCERYVSGYAFVRVPRFRHDAQSWEELTKSFAERVLLAVRHGQRVSNAIARCIDASVGTRDMTAGELLAHLRNPGVWPTLRDDIVSEMDRALRGERPTGRRGPVVIDTDPRLGDQ